MDFQVSLLKQFILLLLLDIGYATQKYHVIGAGLGRTGTSSLKNALSQIGFGEVFHMEVNFRNSHLAPLWKELSDLTPVTYVRKSFDNGKQIRSVPEWPPALPSQKYHRNRIDLLTNILGLNQTYWKEKKIKHSKYHSALDAPTCFYYRDLIDIYTPQKSKVILSQRANGQAWALSAYSTVLQGHPSRVRFGMKLFISIVFPISWISPFIFNTVHRHLPSVLTDDDMDLLVSYHDVWNEDVRIFMREYSKAHSIPLQSIFLEFQAKDGWEPLCKFLEVEDCPTGPFPHVNDKSRIQNIVRVVNVVGYFLASALLFFLYITFKKASKLIKLSFSGEKIKVT